MFSFAKAGMLLQLLIMSKSKPMRAIFVALFAGAVCAGAASAASLSKTYAYFSVSGRTADQLERDMARRGPRVGNSLLGHPGAAELKFTGKIDYTEANGRCRVKGARFHVRARISLPRWRDRKRSDRDLVFVWDTLARDIKRHEEQHVIIAKRHAREIEQEIMALGSARDCKILEARAGQITDRILDKHDRAQAQFDRVEALNYESRLKRLLRYYAQQQGR